MKIIKNSTLLNIGWLYPDLMSTYGDRGNIIALTKRCEWRGIDSRIVRIDQDTSEKEIRTIDLLFGGGAQDMEQDIVMRDLRGDKADTIKKHVEADKPALFVCGAPQLMGKYYEPAVGKRIEGLGIFDMVSENPGPKHPRLIGNVVASVDWDALSVDDQLITNHTQIVGFENHGGRTRLGSKAKPFATTLKGFGNNGLDKTEGVVYKNAIGCYLHGPFLPKNPQVADFLIKRALEVKYKKTISLMPLDDSLEWRAHNAIVKRLGVSV
jgi:CobQ-like glutamine amidotransferase family enzyme